MIKLFEEEKRKYPRLNKSIPVRIILPHQLNSAELSCEGIARNLSMGGIFVESSSQAIDLKPGKNIIILEINLAEENIKINAVAEVIWTEKAKPYENSVFFGAQFKEISRPDQLNTYISELAKEQEIGIVRIIERRLPVKPDADGLPKFTLLINGEDKDTGVYRYYPIAEKAIIEPRKTFEVTSQIRKGKVISAHYKNYIFAKYCVGAGDINQMAIKSAFKAFKIFSKFSLEHRRKIIGDIFDLLSTNREILIELLVAEGHNRNLAEWQLWGIERAFNKKSLDFYISEMWKDLSENDESIYLVRRPDGVVCLSPPKNAPASNSILAVTTFLAGNTLIIKPPIRNPISSIFLWRNIVYEALKKNGAPEGTLNIIVGNSKIIMNEWLDSPLVNDIIFFGESDTGLEIASRAFAKGKKAILELTGNDTLFVWKDAPIDEAVNAFLDCFLGSTQICMVPKKAIVHEDIYNKFVELFLSKVRMLKVGLPNDRSTDLIPVAKIDKFFEFLNDALAKGAELIYGGQRINFEGKDDKNGIFIKPAILLLDDAKAEDMVCVKEENYFPLIPIIKVNAQLTGEENKKDEIIFEKMVEFANSNQYGLRISVWVESDTYGRKFLDEMHNSGLLRINSRHVGFSTYLSSHGGPRRTGGPFGEMNYIWMRTSHLQGISKFNIKGNYGKGK